MPFILLMKEVKAMYENWLNSDTFMDCHNGNKEELQKEFINCIQLEIKSNFILLTKEEYENDLMEFHNSMEGISND